MSMQKMGPVQVLQAISHPCVMALKDSSKLKWTIRGIVVFLLAAMLVTGCTDHNKIPSDVLGREKMEKVLWDMIMADRFSISFVMKDSATKNVKQENFKLYEQVFRLNKTNKDEFIKSYKFYLERPDLSKIMFDSLTARANRERENMYKLSTKPAASVQ